MMRRESVLIRCRECLEDHAHEVLESLNALLVLKTRKIEEGRGRSKKIFLSREYFFLMMAMILVFLG